VVREVLPIGPRLCGLPGIVLPDVGRLCVMVPKKTENWLRFSARLDDGAPEVRFDRVAAS
jgi:hypothetical protein